MGAPSVERLEHWTLVANDVDKTKRFYLDVLGAKEPNRDGGPISVELADTVIDFFPAGEGRQPSPGSGGQHHAYVIPLSDYDAWVEQFKTHDVKTRLATHRLHRMSIYFDDPDGYHFEFFCEFPNDEIGRQEIAKRGLLEQAERRMRRG